MEEPERNPSIMYLLRLLEGRWLLLLGRNCGFPIIPQSSWLDDLVDTKDKREMEVQKWERQNTNEEKPCYSIVPMDISSDLIVRNCLNEDCWRKPGSIIQREWYQTSSPNPKPQMPIHIKWRTKKLEIIEKYLLQLLEERRLPLLRNFPSLKLYWLLVLVDVGDQRGHQSCSKWERENISEENPCHSTIIVMDMSSNLGIKIWRRFKGNLDPPYKENRVKPQKPIHLKRKNQKES